MTLWTKDSALPELRRIIAQMNTLVEERPFSASHVLWLTGTTSFLRQVSGENSLYFQNFGSLTWTHTGASLLMGHEVLNIDAALERRNRVAFQRALEAARGLLQGAGDELGRKDLDAVYEGKDTGPEASLILRVLQLAERKLRRSIKKDPKEETDIQDAVEALLIGADIGYSREAESVEYSSKTYKPDFTVPRADLAVEIKFCGVKGREKEIIAEINDDILAYKQKWGNLFL